MFRLPRACLPKNSAGEQQSTASSPNWDVLEQAGELLFRLPQKPRDCSRMLVQLSRRPAGKLRKPPQNQRKWRSTRNTPGKLPGKETAFITNEWVRFRQEPFLERRENLFV